MSDQGGHSTMAEHAAHSMLDLRDTGGPLDHLAGGGPGPQRDHHGMQDTGLGRRDGIGGGSLTPTMHQMNQHGDDGNNNNVSAGSIMPRPMSRLANNNSSGGSMMQERQSLGQPMRNLTPGLDGRGDGGDQSLTDQGGSVPSSSSLGFNIGGSGSSLSSPTSLPFKPSYQLPPGRVPIIPKRGRPPGSGHHQQAMQNLYKNSLNSLVSSPSSGQHHSQSNLSSQANMMRSISDHHHQSHNGDNLNTSSHNGRVSSGMYSSSGQQLNSRPSSALLSEPSESREPGRPNYSSSSENTNPSSSLIEETIAAVASNLHRSSPNGGLMPGPLPPNSHHHGHNNSLLGGLGGLLPRSSSTGGPGDDSLADLVGRSHASGIPMLSERASQSLSGLMGGDDGSDHHHHHHHHQHGSTGREIEKTHPCLTCLKMFRSKQQLAQHSLVHTGIRKHICSFCDRAFKQLSHLQQHVRIHTGERKYSCKYCDRGFKQLSHLQKHIVIHTGGEPVDVTSSPPATLTPTLPKRGRRPKTVVTTSPAQEPDAMSLPVMSSTQPATPVAMITSTPSGFEVTSLIENH